MLTAIGRLAAAALLTVIWACSALGQTETRELRIVTRVLPPVVVDEKGALTGFGIDLWAKIAERLKLKSNFQIAPDIRALLEAVGSDKAEIGVGAISITAEREAKFDFSQPILNAGLQIIVRGQGRDGEASPLWDLLSLLFSKTILVWIGIALLLIIVPAHVIWLLERRQKNGIIPTESYIPGIFYAMYWAAATLATQADQMPRQWLARIIAVLWMFAGVVFVAFYTAQLAATLTVQQIQGDINGPEDLKGRRVATTRGSTAADQVRRFNAQVQEFSRIEDAYQALLSKKADAVVFDAPVLLYYVAHEGKGRAQVVGPIFHKEDYGIVFQPGSPLRKQINGALLALRENGVYQQIYDKWFTAK
jgi:polar amino acid transport system substrate-binding protein